MDVRTATQSVSVKEGNVPFFSKTRMLKQAMSRMISRMKMSKRLKILMQAKTRLGSLMHSINANPSLLAPPRTAKRKT